MALFNVGPRALVFEAGVTVVPMRHQQAVPGLEVYSECEVEIAEGAEIALNAVNQPSGDLLMQSHGDVHIDGF